MNNPKGYAAAYLKNAAKREKELQEEYGGVPIEIWLKENTKTVIGLAIEVFGATHQKVVAIEELSELIKELCKDIRGIGDRAHIVEEIADVEIMLMQLKEIYKVTEKDLEVQRYKKLTRLESRVIAKLEEE